MLSNASRPGIERLLITRWVALYKKGFSLKEGQIKSAPNRPFWQRIVYPLIGLILIIVGIVLWITPVVAGFPLIIIGIPFLFAFNSRVENRVRCYMHSVFAAVIKKFKKN